MKDAVTQTRQILAERMAAGESPAKVIREARRDLNKIADYRDLLESELHKLADTEDEAYLDSFVAAPAILPHHLIELGEGIWYYNGTLWKAEET